MTGLLLALKLAEQAATKYQVQFFYESEVEGGEDVSVFMFLGPSGWAVSKITTHSLPCHGTLGLNCEFENAASRAGGNKYD